MSDERSGILAAAAAVLAEQGAEAGIDRIARRAGVDPGTVYRHFATKAELVDLVLEQRIAALRAVIERHADVDDAAAAFRQVMHGVVALQVEDRAFRDLLAWRNRASDAPHPALEGLVGAWSGLHDRARAAGAIRADVELADVMLLLIAIDGIAGATGTRQPGALRRVVDIVLDGLCAERLPLGGEPPDGDVLVQVATSR